MQSRRAAHPDSSSQISSYPAIRVFTFGEFGIERLVHSSVIDSADQPPRYEPVHRSAWSLRNPSITMLKILLCRDGRQASRDMLLEAIWPGDKGEAINTTHALHTASSLLRTILRTPAGESLLLTTHGSDGISYKLPGQQYLWVDADAFDEAIEQAARAASTEQDALPLWEAAYQLARNEFLPDDRYSDWSQERLERIRGNRRLCVYRLAMLYSERNRKDEAEMLLRGLWAANPTNEDALCRLMLLLEEQARYQEALLLYERTRQALKEEGSQPTIRSSRLAERMYNPPLVPRLILPLSSPEEHWDHAAQETIPSTKEPFTASTDKAEMPTAETEAYKSNDTFAEILALLEAEEFPEEMLPLPSSLRMARSFYWLNNRKY